MKPQRCRCDLERREWAADGKPTRAGSGQSPSDVVLGAPNSDVGSLWATPVEELLRDLNSDASGLTASFGRLLTRVMVVLVSPGERCCGQV
jgi:hypothetical protein